LVLEWPWGVFGWPMGTTGGYQIAPFHVRVTALLRSTVRPGNERRGEQIDPITCKLGRSVVPARAGGAARKPPAVDRAFHMTEPRLLAVTTGRLVKMSRMPALPPKRHRSNPCGGHA
jgi:hypothetical protein